jgi:hypothetical protein
VRFNLARAPRNMEGMNKAPRTPQSLQWDPTAPPWWLADAVDPLAPSLGEIQPLAVAADAALEGLIAAVENLARARSAAAWPADFQLAQALVAGFLRIANASGQNLDDFALFNPFGLCVGGATFADAIAQSAKEHAARAESTRRLREQWVCEPDDAPGHGADPAQREGL